MNRIIIEEEATLRNSTSALIMSPLSPQAVTGNYSNRCIVTNHAQPIKSPRKAGTFDWSFANYFCFITLRKL